MIFLGYIIIIIALMIIFSGIIGLYRFPDFYTRLHAAGIIESCGVPLCLIGLACLQDNFINSFKLMLASALIILLNPVATHALGKASLIMKIRAYPSEREEK